MASLGENIKAARTQRGMTQEQLAFELQTTKAAISRYELNKRQPRNDQLRAIATALDVSVGYLLGYDDIDTQKILSAFKKGDFNTVEKLTDLPSGFIASLHEKGLAKFEGLLRKKISGSEILLDSLFDFIRGRYSELTPDEEVTLEELIGAFSRLNDDGRIAAVCRIQELAEIPKFKKSFNDSDSSGDDDTDEDSY